MGHGALIDPLLRHMAVGVVIKDDAFRLELVQHPLLPDLAFGSLVKSSWSILPEVRDLLETQRL